MSLFHTFIYGTNKIGGIAKFEGGFSKVEGALSLEILYVI